MNAVVPFNPASLAVALKSTARAAGGGITSFLKMEKTGTWVFGIEQEELTSEDTLMVDPRTFVHGHVAWEDDNVGNKLGEEMAPITSPMPPLGPVPDGADRWQFQLGVGMVLIDGGTPLMYSATSVGGKRAIGSLATAIGEKMASGDKECVPIVSLDSDSYQHKKYGKIFNPIITIESWTTIEKMDAAAEAGKPQVPAKPATKAPAKGKPAPAPAKKTSRR